MKKLRFIRGSSFIELIVNNRKISFMTPLLSMVPMEIDLNKLDEQQEKIRKMNLDTKTLKQLNELETEEQMVDDLIKDLRQKGWEVHEYASD